MSFFTKLFGGKKEETKTTGEAIQELRNTEDLLNKKQQVLEKKIEQEVATAKQKLAAKNKRAALQALQRKKRLEKQLVQLDGTLSTLELQREALEGANTNTAVLTTMKNASDALKTAHQHMNVDDVHDMMDDIAEQQDVAREISDAISNPIAFGHDIDEDELNAELEALEQEELDKELIGVGPSAHELPEVPSGEVKEPAAEKKKAPPKPAEDDDDMKALMSWAN